MLILAAAECGSVVYALDDSAGKPGLDMRRVRGVGKQRGRGGQESTRLRQSSGVTLHRD